MSFPIERSDDQWRALLSPQEYAVLRQGATDAPFVGEYTDLEDHGSYFCRGCFQQLFQSETKFHSGCGWPSFFAPVDTKSIVEKDDTSLGMRRTEVQCANCGSHLGHVFLGEGFPTPTNARYCINSSAIVFKPSETTQQ